ncbi:MAG TPA: hypothetical protein PKC72_01240 [Chitinophagaceae bacterium]|nr:hypothetical protein [Chitinophagaceae bacterium]
MKKLLLLTGMISFFITCIGQQLPTKEKTAEFYKHKATKQNSLGWTLLGCGTGVLLIGMAIYPSDYNWLGWGNDPEDKKQADAADIVSGIGLAGMITSVPFFIASGINRRKSRAATIGFKFENRPVIQQYSLSKKQFPALSLKISL